MGGMSAEDQDKGWQDWTVGGEAGLYSIVNNLLVMVNIINISLATGIVPTSFKKAVVQPIIKKAGDPSACKNFRPVSNLPFISKLLERIVAEQLVQHLSGHN
nr:hypothetical protein BaRGS_000092 [Batillaria attramentaria]